MKTIKAAVLYLEKGGLLPEDECLTSAINTECRIGNGTTLKPRFNDAFATSRKETQGVYECKEALGNISCRKETMLMENVKREGCGLWMVFEGKGTFRCP